MTKTNTKYRVVVWGQKGNRAGNRIIGKKEYAQQGSARKYAQQRSSEKNVNYVELKVGDDVLDTYKKGDLVTSPKAAPAKTPEKKRAIKSAPVQSTDDGASRYRAMVDKHHRGELKAIQHYSKFGITKAKAKKIRADVRATTGPKVTSVKIAPVKRGKVAAASDRYDQHVKAKQAKIANLESKVAVEKATLEAAMQALLRERMNAVQSAQAELEDTLAQCSQLGVHASIA